jgi:hypothetical protein
MLWILGDISLEHTWSVSDKELALLKEGRRARSLFSALHHLSSQRPVSPLLQ